MEPVVVSVQGGSGGLGAERATTPDLKEVALGGPAPSPAGPRTPHTPVLWRSPCYRPHLRLIFPHNHAQVFSGLRLPPLENPCRQPGTPASCVTLGQGAQERTKTVSVWLLRKVGGQYCLRRPSGGLRPWPSCSSRLGSLSGPLLQPLLASRGRPPASSPSTAWLPGCWGAIGALPAGVAPLWTGTGVQTGLSCSCTCWPRP